MTTIPDTIGKIASDIQNVSSELIKLLLKKTLRLPDKANNYIYILTNKCLGWTDNSVINFKLFAKFIKNNKMRPKTPVAFSPRERIAYENSIRTIDNTQVPYKKFLEYLTAENIQNIITNNKAGTTYTTDILYTDSWKQLESIGLDIIKQIDVSIDPEVSARMSTALLRIKLYNLEQNLNCLAVEYPNIYISYLEMVVLINSIDRTYVDWLVALIGHLSYLRWDALPTTLQATFIDIFGTDFIDAFNANELITILIQSDLSELILTASYLYSLLKMLFIVFGYNELIPHIIQRPDVNFATVNAAIPIRDIRSIDCIYDTIDIFQDLYPTINEIISDFEQIPILNKNIDLALITPDYDDLNVIPAFLWKFMEYSYCIYRDYTDSKIKINSIYSRINNKINYLESF